MESEQKPNVSKERNEKLKNKKDWEEIKKWSEKQEAKREIDYGIDITKLGKEHKKIDKLAKVLSIIVKVIYWIGKGGVILATILGLLWVITTFMRAGQVFGS